MANVLTQVLEGLMRRYRERVPDVAAILDTMVREGLIRDAGEIENDHIAFRSLGVPHLGIASLEKIFLHLGYVRRDPYFFSAKKLNAFWYAPPEPHLPRIFLSELRVQDLPEGSRAVVGKYTQSIQRDPVDGLDLDDAVAIDQFLHSGNWPVPSLEDYELLAADSEYASWAIYNRYYLNHFTISVHNLPEGYNTVADFNNFLEAHGFVLNDSGGKIKISPDGGLLQSSTVARMVEAEFAGGKRAEIPGSYVEFAERRVLPAYAHLPASAIHREHRREGFEAGNADKIFESTFTSQTGRRGD
jgi:2-oxoadipate dioxygenase/decarboxylase-like protein